MMLTVERPTVTKASMSQGLVEATPSVRADTALLMAVEYRYTGACSVLCRPTAMYSELLLMMWCGGRMSSPCSWMNRVLAWVSADFC